MIFRFKMKRMRILLALLALSMCAIPFRDRLIRVARLFKHTYNVEQRLAQYGWVVHERLTADFERVKCPYPPAKLLLIGLKQEKQLEVWVKPDSDKEYVLLRGYPIKGASGKLGPKLVEGDGQVPEGIYRIDWLNPNSAFHLSMHIDYPNAYDKARAAEDGRANLGGDIMIHGGRGSSGCLAMGDEAAEDLFVLVAETGLSNVEVILSPVDFRVRDLTEKTKQGLPAWTDELYRIIQGRLATNVSPEVLFARGGVALRLQAWSTGATNYWEQSVQMISTNNAYSEIGRTNVIKRMRAMQEVFAEIGGTAPPTWNTYCHSKIFSIPLTPDLDILEELATLSLAENQ